jgi:hypothetical protein
LPEILAHSWVSDAEEHQKNTGVGENKTKMAWEEEEIKTSPNINVINLDHIFRNFNCKLTYSDYQSIAEEFDTTHIEEEALQVVTTLGYPRDMVVDKLKRGELNHATACYNLLVHC